MFLPFSFSFRNFFQQVTTISHSGLLKRPDCIKYIIQALNCILKSYISQTQNFYRRFFQSDFQLKTNSQQVTTTSHSGLLKRPDCIKYIIQALNCILKSYISQTQNFYRRFFQSDFQLKTNSQQVTTTSHSGLLKRPDCIKYII